MKLTRSQQIVLVVLGVLTIGVYGCLVSTIVRNSRQASPASLSAAQTEEPTSSPTATASPTPTPTPTPIPPAPQTRYDLQVAHEPENPTLRLQRGYAYIALDAPTYAVEDFRAAIELDDALAEAYAGRGDALALNPDLADAHAWRGYLLSERGRHGPAIEALRQAVELDKGDPWKRLVLAQALLHSGSPGEAKIEYTAALALEGRSTEAYVGRAMAYAEEGDLDAAQADLDSARDVAPHDPVVLNGQAWLYAWYRNDRLPDAEQLAQRAVAGAEDDLQKARYLHTLGWVYYQQERYVEAVATLEEAAALATVEGEVVYGEIVEHLEEAK
jgi:tetratricopeptide (TPR) repeat protein